MLWRLWILIIKEFQIILRDKKSRYVLIVPPIVQTLLFGFAATLEVKNVTVAVYNRDNGYYGKELSHRIHASSSFHNIIYLGKETDIAPAIDNRKALLGISIPEDFSKSIINKESADLQIILDGRRSNTSQIAQNYITSIIQNLLSDINGTPGQIQIIPRTWFNPNKNYHWFTVPGLIGIIMALVILLLTGLSVARERELGTFEQLQVSPLSSIEIIIGKTIPALTMGLLEGTIVIMLALILFKVPLLGSVSLLYFSMFLYALAMIGIGLFISALVQTQQQAMLGTFLVMVPVILLSGFMTPVEYMPHWLQTFIAWNPFRYFLIIVKSIFLKDVSFKIILWEEIYLAIIAFCTLSASVWFFRKRLA